MSNFCFIILHFRNRQDTLECLHSIARNAVEDDCILVVDNSWDLTDIHDEVTSKSQLNVMRPSENNPGFARGMNEGVRSIESDKFDVLVFINNDTVFEDDFRDKLVGHFDVGGKQLAVIGPKIVFKTRPDIIWSAGGKIDRKKMSSEQEFIFCPENELKGVFETEFVSGCVLAIRQHIFKKIGGWPDQYLFGGEEWELSTELRRRGYRLEINADITVKHRADLEVGQGASHSFEDLRFVLNGYLNRIIYALRNHSSFEALVFRLRLLLFLMIVMPLKWKNIGPARSFGGKLKLAFALACALSVRDASPVTWDELELFADKYGNT